MERINYYKDLYAFLAMQEIYPDLFYFEYSNQRELARRFKRFYGHYESPELKGKVFTEGKFDAWFRNNTIYGKEYDLNFSEIVGGVNFPNWVFDAFLSGKFDPLNDYEKEIVDYVQTINREKFYVISAIENNSLDLNHEIAHGLYYLNSEYYSKANAILSEIDKRNYSRMEKELIDEGVTHEDNLRDEVHAHLLTNHYVFCDKISEKFLIETNKKFIDLFENYFK